VLSHDSSLQYIKVGINYLLVVVLVVVVVGAAAAVVMSCLLFMCLICFF